MSFSIFSFFGDCLSSPRKNKTLKLQYIALNFCTLVHSPSEKNQTLDFLQSLLNHGGFLRSLVFATPPETPPTTSKIKHFSYSFLFFSILLVFLNDLDPTIFSAAKIHFSLLKASGRNQHCRRSLDALKFLDSPGKGAEVLHSWLGGT